MLWWFSPCGGLCQLEARDQQNQSKRINFAILSCKIKFTPKWVILLKKFSRLQGWWNSSQHSKVKLNCKSVLINLIIFFFNLADQDVDENVLRKLPDCQVGSLEERLLADIVPSIGRRLKIINAIREVAAVSTLQNKRLFNCSICKSNFQEFNTYWNHLISFHEISKGTARINCPLCSTIFTSTETLKNHVKLFCPKNRSRSVNSNLAIRQDISQITEEEIGPNLLADITTDYKLAFVKTLQMSGSISLVKSAEILSSANSLVNSIVDIAKNFVNNTTEKDDLLIKLSTLKDPFHNSNCSQYLIEKSLKDQKIYSEATEIKLGSHFKFDVAAGSVIEKFDFMYYFDLRKSLPIILSHYKLVCNFVLDDSNNFNLFLNFKSGKYFRKLDGNPLCLQIYYDDIEICNPLGAKAKIHKLAMFYFIIANFPPHFKSQLSTIFPLLIVKSKLLKEYGINNILKPMVDEFKKLSVINPQDILLELPFTHVVLLQVCGDNLGLHSLLGYTEGFNANYRCRFCKGNKHFTQTAVEEEISLRRNIANYSSDLVLGDISLTGIREGSILNEISYFHVTENYAPDIMHDFFEGICIIELKLALDYLIKTKKITLQQINHQISTCFKKNSHKVNKFPEISQQFICDEKKSCFSASEMNNFFLVFPAIFLAYFDDDKMLNLILKLRRIIRIIMAPLISREGVSLLRYLISDHHQLYINLTCNNLTPKFHHILHYPHAIEQLGPLKNFWCMRLEAKHRFSKIVGKNSYNFKNIAKSVAKRLSLNMAFSINSSKGDGIMQIKFGGGVRIRLDELKGNFDFSLLNIGSEEIILSIEFVSAKGTIISRHKYFILGSNENQLQFCQVELCFVHDDQVYICVSPITCVELLHNSYLFKVTGKKTAIIIKPELLDLEHPLIVANTSSEYDVICCPIELV